MRDNDCFGFEAGGGRRLSRLVWERAPIGDAPTGDSDRLGRGLLRTEQVRLVRCDPTQSDNGKNQGQKKRSRVHSPLVTYADAQVGSSFQAAKQKPNFARGNRQFTG